MVSCLLQPSHSGVWAWRVPQKWPPIFRASYSHGELMRDLRFVLRDVVLNDCSYPAEKVYDLEKHP